MANEKISQPPILEASLKPSPFKLSIKVGRTGIIIPNPMTSIKMVRKINDIDAFPFFSMGAKIVLVLIAKS